MLMGCHQCDRAQDGRNGLVVTYGCVGSYVVDSYCCAVILCIASGDSAGGSARISFHIVTDTKATHKR